MADIWFDVDTALSEVPVNLIALTDDTDFKTREESVTYNQSGLDLVWNFVTTAGAMAQTAVTPTDTGGAYDWVNQGNGMYSIEIPASGGASINNDTEGFGWFTGFATGILPWRGPVIGFRASGLNDKLIDSAYSATRGLAGTALPDAAADAAGGLPISDDGGLDMDAIKEDTAAILADTNELQTDDTPGALAAIDAKIDTIDGLADDILEDTGTTIPATLETIDNFLDTEVAAILEDTGTTLPATLSTMDGKLDTIDGIADDILEDTGTTIPGTITTIDDEIAVIDANVDAILADTGTDGVALTAAAVDAILDEVVEGTYTMRQYLRLFASALLGKVSGGGSTTITFRDTGDTKNRIVATVDTNGTRSAVTLTET